eukprot:756461-Hanusia_phi.AAC.4
MRASGCKGGGARYLHLSRAPRLVPNGDYLKLDRVIWMRRVKALCSVMSAAWHRSGTDLQPFDWPPRVLPPSGMPPYPHSTQLILDDPTPLNRTKPILPAGTLALGDMTRTKHPKVDQLIIKILDR